MLASSGRPLILLLRPRGARLLATTRPVPLTGLATAARPRHKPRPLPQGRLRGLSASPGATPAAAAAPEAAGAPAAAGAGAEGSGSKGSGPGFISRNIGKIMLTALTALVAYLYRGSENKKRQKALKVYLEDRRAIEPWEIDELRMANHEAIDRETFRAVLAALQAAHPAGQASYRECIETVSRALGPARRLQMAHYLDRVMLALKADGGPVDLLTFMCALSLTLNAPLEDRIGALYDLVSTMEGAFTLPGLQKLVAGLVATSQVPAEALVIPDKEQQYPFQAYRVATVEEITDRAVKEVNEAAAKAKPPGPGLDLTGGKPLTPEELTVVLATKAVCAWGECYAGRG